MRLVVGWGVLIFVATTTANLNIDFSNANLANFQYFRYKKPPVIFVPSKNIYIRPIPRPEHPFIRAFRKVAAVIQYFKHVFTGHPLNNQRMRFVFDQERAEADSVEFQKKFGRRGKELIELLGNGFRGNSPMKKK